MTHSKKEHNLYTTRHEVKSLLDEFYALLEQGGDK